ncbi:LysR substrate-binding domain-containing protein [Aeromonas caviae]
MDDPHAARPPLPGGDQHPGGPARRAQAGLGLAVLPHYLARQTDLVCLLPELGVDQPIWLVLHSDLAHSRRVRAVADHLIALFERARTALHPFSGDPR